jgi:hypothetical protein
MQAAMLRDDIVKSVKKQPHQADGDNTDLEDNESDTSINLGDATVSPANPGFEEIPLSLSQMRGIPLYMRGASSKPPKISYQDSENAREGRMYKGIPRIRDNTSEQGEMAPDRDAHARIQTSQNRLSWRDKVQYDAHTRRQGQQEDDAMLLQDVMDPMGWSNEE